MSNIHTCHHHTLPQSCACIHWNWPSHSRENAGRSVQCKEAERREKTKRKRRIGQVRNFKYVDMTEERGEQNRTERGEKKRFQLLPIMACASYSLSQCLMQQPRNEIRLTDCCLFKVITYAYQMRTQRQTESISFRLVIHIC